MRDLCSILAVARSRWFWMIAGILLGVAVIAANSLLLAISGWFITSMAVAGIAKVSFNYFVPAASIRALAIGRTVGRYIERLVTHEAAFRMLSDVRVWLFRMLEPLSPAGLEHYSSGELAGRLRSDIDSLEALYLRIIAPIATGIVTIVAATVFVAYWNIPAAIILFVVLMIPGVLLPVAIRRFAETHGKKAATLAGDLRTTVTDGIHGGAELILLGAIDKHAASVDDLSCRLTDQQDRLAAASAATLAAILLSAGAGGAALLLVCTGEIASGGVDGPQMVMLLLFSAAVFEATGGISAAMHLLPGTAASAGRISELSAKKPPVTEPVSPLPLPTEFSLILKNVTFSYDGISQVLSGLTFELPAGTRVALTGGSGSGKSTVAEILLRFRDYHGSITIGGTELRSLSGDGLRQLFAFLPQKPHLFNSTIRENILLAKPGATDTELTALLHDTLLDIWVENLPEGLETRVGEGGCAVSGGEARRIALARALLKDAPLVILDEPTEGLDAETERVLLERVGRRLSGKSLLLISHRPAPLALADRIIVLN